MLKNKINFLLYKKTERKIYRNQNLKAINIYKFKKWKKTINVFNSFN